MRIILNVIAIKYIYGFGQVELWNRVELIYGVTSISELHLHASIYIYKNKKVM